VSDSKIRYTLYPESEMKWLDDGSGIAIYNAYSGNTHFLNVINFESCERTSLPELKFPFLADDFQSWLNLHSLDSDHTLKQMVERKIFRLTTEHA
jgi:hypothetical protein